MSGAEEEKGGEESEGSINGRLRWPLTEAAFSLNAQARRLRESGDRISALSVEVEGLRELCRLYRLIPHPDEDWDFHNPELPFNLWRERVSALEARLGGERPATGAETEATTDLVARLQVVYSVPVKSNRFDVSYLAELCAEAAREIISLRAQVVHWRLTVALDAITGKKGR